MSEPTDKPETPAPAEPPAQPISARAGSYYRNMRYLMCTMIVVMGFWFMYDGHIGYPEHNRKHDELTAQIDAATVAGDSEKVAELTNQRQDMGNKHSDADLQLQRMLGYAMPPLGIYYLIYMLRKSRGEYRLENDILTAPGHPPVPIGSITKLDNSLWERKGIAKLDYKLADGTEGKLTLDDFIYQRKPIDDIHAVITHRMKG